MSINVSARANTLAYLGVEAPTPPNLVESINSPTTGDGFNMIIGTLWIRRGPGISPEEVWMLVNQTGTVNDGTYIGTWIQLFPGSGGNFTFTTQGGTPATFINNNLNVYGGSNITTNSLIGPGDTITIDLNANVAIPGSLQVGDLSNGVVFADANGNLFTANGTDGQVIVGGGVAPIFVDLIAGTNINFVTGPNSLTINATGGGGSGTTSFITDVGGPAVPTGGGALNLIGNGTVIQTDGSVANTVQILMTEPDPGYVLGGNGAGLQPTFQQLIGGGSIVITPGVGTITISDGGGGGGGVVQLTGDVGAAAQDAFNNIDVVGGGTTNILTTGAASTLTIKLIDDPSIIGSLTVGTDLTVSGLGATPGVVQVDNTGFFSASNGTDGQILIAATGGSPAWANITAGAGISITNNANAITITNTGGGGGGGGALNFITNSGTAVVVSSNIQVYGDGVFPLGNIQTSAVPAGGNVVTVALNGSIILPMTNTNINNLSKGQFWIGGNRFMHMWGPNTNDANTFLGRNSGNFTFGQTAAVRNSGFGVGTLNSLTTGGDNTAVGRRAGTSVTSGTQNTLIGSDAGDAINSGGQNTAVGYSALGALNSGANNTAIGYRALEAAPGSASDNIALGSSAGLSMTSGSGNIFIGNVGAAESNTTRIGTSQTAAYMAGIYNRSVGSTNGVMVVDNVNKMGSITGTANQILVTGGGGTGVTFKSLTSSNNSITITPSGSAIDLTTTSSTVLFSYYLAGTVANVTGDNSTYVFGTTSAFTQQFDIGSNVSAGGGGNPVRFTAPYNGVYLFTVNCLLTNLVAPQTTPPNPVCPLIISLSGAVTNDYALIGSFWWPQTTDPAFQRVQNYFYTAYIPMTASQSATFSISTFYGAGTKTLGLGGQINFGSPGPITRTVFGTMVQGNLIART